MARTITPAARALKLIIAMAFVCSLMILPGFDAQAGSGADEAPAKVRRGAGSSVAPGWAAVQAPILGDRANAPIGAAVAAAAEVSNTLPLTSTFRVFLPVLRADDRYLDWVALGQPAGAVAVNHLYTSQNCVGNRPAVILAGTDQGLYSYGTTWTRNPGLAAEMEVSQIFSTTQGELYVSSYNLGLWRSVNSGASWAPDPTPNNDARVYGLAETNQYLYAASRLGLYRRSSSGGAWSQIQDGVIYTVAAVDSNVYAVQVGTVKDTLFISNDGGNTWPIARELPGAVNFVQTLDADSSNPQILIGAVDGGLFTLDGGNNVIPFSQGLGQTVYGIWRDAQKRIYVATDTPGGLRRFAQSGGTSDRDLSALPTGGSLAAQTLYTVNGSTACNIIAVASEAGGVWMRRVP